MNLPRRVWLEINLKTEAENYRKIAASVAPAKVLVVLKANAYGLGVLPVATALAKEGAAGFGVAEPHEALQLLPLGKPVQILSSVLPDEVAAMVEAGVILPVTDEAMARLISAEAVRQRKTAAVEIALDTGMGRIGFRTAEAPDAIRRVVKLPGLKVQGILSHFPCAYDQDSELTRRQIRDFKAILTTLAADGITFEKRHIANSDAINNYPEACREPFNYVRAGINLHGSFDPAGKRALNLESVLTLKTRLAAIRDLPAGTGIGYGQTYRLNRPTRIGVISAGYADGMPLALSNRGYVSIRGTVCPVFGRICMDYTMVSLESVPEAKLGDEVICLGHGAPSPEDWAALKGTHAYEIICSFGNRVERVYR